MERKIDIVKAIDATLDWFAQDETHEALVDKGIETVFLAHVGNESFVTGSTGGNLINMLDALTDTVLKKATPTEGLFFLTGLASIIEDRIVEYKDILEEAADDQND